MKLCAFLCLGLFIFPAIAAADAPALFVSLKCVKCHSIDSQNIEGDKEKDPSKIHDLSQVGAGFESTDEIKAFIMRETTRKDKKHKTKFKGTDEELEVLIKWLKALHDKDA